MATLAEQLAGLPVAHSLQNTGIPASFTKLPWATFDSGTWTTSGWSPTSYVLTEEPSSRSGAYFNSTLYKGNVAVGVTRAAGATLLNADRRLGIWLFTAAGAKASGYQLQWVTVAKEDFVKIVLSKWVEGVRTVLGEVAETPMAVGDSFFLSVVSGKLSAWRQPGAGAPVLLFEAIDATFTEGRIAVDGNGSNPIMANLVAGEVNPEVVALAGLQVVRSQPDSGRLAFYVRRTDGTEKRLAGDEPDAEDMGRGFGFGTSIPGGYGNANLGLTRDPRIEYGEFDLFDEFIARGPGGESAFEGYNVEIPNTGTEEVGLVATGWAGSLKDNPTLQEIYVDRDIGRWGDVTAAAKISMLSANLVPGNPNVISDPSTGMPALELQMEGNWSAPWKPLIRAAYDAGPSAKIRLIAFGFKGVGGAAADGTFSLEALTGADPNWITGYTGSGDIYAGGEGQISFTPSTANRYGMFQFGYPSTPAGVAGVVYGIQVRDLLVVGNHTAPLTSSNGVLASDVVADILNKVAPYLTFTTGNEGSIQASSFSIPHLIYPEAVSPEDAILQASKYDVPDWGVYNDREFFWRSPDSGRLWVSRQGDSGVTLQDVGKQADDVYNGVMVQFTDPSGKTFLVGPPETPGCDFTDASLKDYSETNPLNERGRTRLGKLTVSAVTTLAGAIQLGARWLQEELVVSDRGSAIVTGFVQDSAGILEPVWKVRAGDRIRFDDADGRERRIIETNYNHEERTNSLTLDSTEHRLDALMERMQVVLTAVGAGS